MMTPMMPPNGGDPLSQMLGHLANQGQVTSATIEAIGGRLQLLEGTLVSATRAEGLTQKLAEVSQVLAGKVNELTGVVMQLMREIEDVMAVASDARDRIGDLERAVSRVEAKTPKKGKGSGDELMDRVNRAIDRI